MAKPEDIGKSITAPAAPKPRGLQDLIQSSAKELGRALPAHMNPERLVRIALTCIRLTPKLATCTPESFLGALFTAAQLGIEPIAGRAYIIPFNNSKKTPQGWVKVMEAQYVLGYKGVIELFYRHGKAVQIDWGIVKENDEFEYEQGTSAFLRHKPAPNNRGKTMAFWVMASLAGGGKVFMVMTLEECMEHAKAHSKTYDLKTGQFYNDSPWATDPEPMCLKTVLIQLAKLLPLSVELQQAIQQDETSKDYKKGVTNYLDVPSNTEWTPPAQPVPAAEVPKAAPVAAAVDERERPEDFHLTAD